MSTRKGSQIPDTVLIGREEELAAGAQLLRTIVAGRSEVLVITGEPGIGKTALAQHLSNTANSLGIRTVWTWCWAATEASPFWPWRQAARELGWEGIEWTDVAAVFEVLVTKIGPDPLLIVLDDAHGADEASLSLVNLLSRSLSSKPFGIVITVCEEDVPQSSRVAQLLDEVSRGGKRMDLFGLGKHPAVELLARSGGDVPVLVQEAIVSASGGNPYLIEQLAKDSVAGRDLHRPDRSLGFNVPRGADAVLERVIRRLSAATIETLSTAAVLGRMFSRDLLVAVTATAEDSLAGHLTEAVEKGAIERIDSLGTFGFTHVLLREFLYEGLSDDRRAELHLAAAHEIEGLDDPDRVGELADHLFKAGTRQPDVRHAVEVNLEAGRQAHDLGSTDEAARHLYRASRLARAVQLHELADQAEARIDVQPQAETEGIDPLRGVFRPEGEYWSVGLGGSVVLLKGSKGMGYISQLLSTPQVEWHCLELASPARRNERAPASDTGPVLDAEAKAQFRARLLDLEEEIAESTAYNDEGRLRKAEAEKQFLLDELSAATGLGGRDRTVGSDSERARVAVTRAIRSALRRVSAAYAALGDHLDRTIQTGTFLSYRPDPMATPNWEL